MDAVDAEVGDDAVGSVIMVGEGTVVVIVDVIVDVVVIVDVIVDDVVDVVVISIADADD